jgi:Plasmid recombination enzyme
MTPPSPAPYAVLRVDRRKAKAMAAISAASDHHMQTTPSPNHDPEGPPPLVLHLAAGKTPYQAAKHLLEGAVRRNRETVLCREIVLSASPSYFRPGREDKAGVFDHDRMKAWTVAALAWAKRQWPDQLASAILHLSEASPHIHICCVPRVKTAGGEWKLNSKALFDRQRLREMQSSYADAMAPLGIRRGEAGSDAVHVEVAQFYGALQAAKAAPPQRPKLLPPPPKPPDIPSVLGKIKEAAAAACGIETKHRQAMRTYQAALQRWRREAKAAKEQEGKEWERLQAAAATAPLTRRRPKRDEPVPRRVQPSQAPQATRRHRPPAP